jgi:SAM-dependent methyltransferase
MDGFDDATYGERIASVYDQLATHAPADAVTGTPHETAAFLADLAGDGRALELAIGTGRIGLPLAARGTDLTGIDNSPAMVAELRAKPGGAAIPVVMGDFADVEVTGPFRLIFVVFNTFFALRDEERQRRCLRNVASRLEPGGTFVVEAFVPDLDRYVDGQHLRVRSITVDQVFLDASIHHPAEQRVDAQHIVLRSGGVDLFPVSIRYLWPEQLDAMADDVGLRLRDRFADWRGSPFTVSSGFHISVYEAAS